jgi:hypothetical protein
MDRRGDDVAAERNYPDLGQYRQRRRAIASAADTWFAR